MQKDFHSFPTRIFNYKIHFPLKQHFYVVTIDEMLKITNSETVFNLIFQRKNMLDSYHWNPHALIVNYCKKRSQGAKVTCHNSQNSPTVKIKHWPVRAIFQKTFETWFMSSITFGMIFFVNLWQSKENTNVSGIVVCCENFPPPIVCTCVI
jgi:hypothetical protein